MAKGYLFYNTLLMRACGQLGIKSTATPFEKIKHHAWRFFLNVCLFCLLGGVVLDIFTKTELPFSAVALNYEYAVITVCSLLKSNYHFIFDYKTARIIRKLNDTFRYETNTKLQEKNIRNCMSLCQMFMATWTGASMYCGTMFLVIRYYYDDISERPLPLPLWYSKAWMVSPYYEMVCMVHVLLQVNLITSWTANDMLFSAVLLLTAEQFKFIGWEFKHLVYTSLIRIGISKEEVMEFKRKLEDPLNVQENSQRIYETIESKQFAKVMAYGFNKLIEYHQSLISFCELIEDFYSPIMLVFSTVIMGVLSFVISVILTNDDTSLRFTGLTYIVCASYSILFPCLMAEILTSQSEKLQQDIYDMPWYLCDKNCKMNLKFLLHRVNKEVTVSVGKFSNLNLNLFIRILNTAMSYGLVISQLAEDTETVN